MTKENKEAEREIQSQSEDLESTEEKLKYLRAVFFIVTNEFCVRFFCHGMRSILVLYTFTVIYRIFTMLVYVFPLMGAMLAHSLSLLLIGLGIGGIKPSVSAFGGDQFILMQQERYLSVFFSVFYFAINSRSLMSTFVTPILRSDVSYFGESTCYSLAFFVPAILMIFSIIVFRIGKNLYIIKDPEGNIFFDVSKCIWKLKYPKAVFFIVTNEFCERFSYYGMRTILVLYLRNKLNYDDDTATVIYHIFTMLVYFFPLLGAMLADSLLGKFKTIFYVSMIYAVGQLLLSASAAPPLGLPTAEMSFVGLILIALGTGGIKPCVSAFGGDQFILPQQERYLSVFFSVFYFAINSGSLISTFVTPILRSDVSCFGESTCYSLAFFVPAILMIFSIIVFRIGKNLYIIKDPEGNILFDVSKCIWHAISKKCCSKKVQREHWLDHADDKYDKKLIEDIKAAMQVLKLFLPLPVFWALFDQQGSRWTFQATRMNGELGSYTIKADQMQVVNPLLILAFIPLCESCIYPLLAKIKLINTPLKKMVTGGCLASLAFIISAVIELNLEPTYAVTPSAGLAQFRIFNTLDCTIPMTIGNKTVTLNGLSYWEDKYVPASGNASVSYTANFAACSLERLSDEIGQYSGTLEGPEATATSWVVTRTGLSYKYEDKVDKTTTGDPAVRGLILLDSYMSNTASLRFIANSKTELHLTINSTFSETELIKLDDGTYDIYLDSNLVQSSVAMKLGGIYTVVGSLSNSTAKANTITVTEPNSMHMLWLIPQYVLLTLGEVMFSITGLEFAFTQAPISMKSILTAGWLLTVAFGNLIVVIVAEVSYFNSQASEFFLFAGLMLIDMLIFCLMAKFYKYVEIPDTESQNGDIALENKTGTVNESFRGDDGK